MVDVNNDSSLESIAANYGTNNIGVLLNVGNGTFSRQITYSTGPNCQPSFVITVDVNGDNKLDIVVASSNGNNIGVLFNVGNGTLTSQTICSTGDGSGSRSLTTADMNGDNKPDIIVANSDIDNVCVLLNLGDGTFTIPSIYSTGYGSFPHSVTTADVDGDGKRDIIVANYGTNIVNVLVNVGNGMFTSGTIYLTGNRYPPYPVTLIDVNGDHKPDIIGVNYGDDAVGVLLNLGNGMFSSPTIYSTGYHSSPSSLATADTNGDNQLDMIVAKADADNVIVLLDTGNGTFSM